MILIIDTKQKQIHKTGLPCCEERIINQILWQWVITLLIAYEIAKPQGRESGWFLIQRQMKSGRVKPATQHNKSTPRSVCLLIFLIDATPHEIQFNWQFKWSERKFIINWCQGEIVAMSVEWPKDEMAIGGRNFHGDVCDVQIKIMWVSWWDWWGSRGKKIEHWAI